MYKYKVTIAYEGTRYQGWQIQPHAESIQEIISKTLQIILREEVHLLGAGRTDTGVHACGQVAHFTTSKEIDVRRCLHSLNGLLPNDIRILDIASAAPDFHSQ